MTTDEEDKQNALNGRWRNSCRDGLCGDCPACLDDYPYNYQTVTACLPPSTHQMVVDAANERHPVRVALTGEPRSGKQTVLLDAANALTARYPYKKYFRAALGQVHEQAAATTRSVLTETAIQNRGFQIAFCETNLRWLAKEPPSEDRTRRERLLAEEIRRLSGTRLEETSP